MPVKVIIIINAETENTKVGVRDREIYAYEGCQIIMRREKVDRTADSTSLGATTATDDHHQPHISDFNNHKQNYHNLETTVTVLWVLTPFLSTISVLIVCTAISTNHWLITQENMENPNYNGTGDNEYLPKRTVSGLWTLCYTNPGENNLVCSNIEYFPNEEYSPDPNDSTMAIPYTVTKSATFFILSIVLLVIGEFYCLCGHFSHHRRLSTFISGVIFIISGLLMLIGLVMYISIFKAEIGGKLRPRSQLQPAVFTFQYGFSFILYVTGFISTEISGTCAVFLYIYWHKKEWHRKRNELREKFSTSAVLLNVNPIEEMFPICKKHPHYTPSLYISDNNGLIIPRQNDERFHPCVDQRFHYRHGGSNTVNETLMPCLKHNNMCSNFFEQYSPNHIITSKYRYCESTKSNNDSVSSVSPELYQYPLMSVLERDFIIGKNNFPRDATTNTISTIAGIETDDTDDFYVDEAETGRFLKYDINSSSISVPVSSKCCDIRTYDCEINTTIEGFSKTTPV